MPRSKPTSSRASARSATAARAARPQPSRRRTTGSPGSKPRSKATSTPRPEPAAPRYCLVTGKGGVGKTTCAAGLALHAARSGARTLVITTDPAPSLGDVFNQPLSGTARRVRAATGRLDAVEIDAQGALERWLPSRRASLERMAVRGTWLDDDDIARLLRLSLPGIDEIAALLEILRFARSGRYDLVVVDTAPTGHALRMLSLPEGLARLAELFDAMQARHRAVAEALRGYWQPDREDALIAELQEDARELHALLRDTSRTETLLVTLPEPMSVEETGDSRASLHRSAIPVTRIVVNRLTPPAPEPCARCDARQAFEFRAVEQLRVIARGTPIVGVWARDREPRNARALMGIGVELSGARPIGRPPRRRRAAWSAPVPSGPHDEAAVAEPGTRLLLFGGKGGVGKTTCAAAAAIRIAASDPKRRVLLLSTDPAHSLADVLGVPLSDEPRRIPGGPERLVVRELDAARRFRELHARYAAAVDALFDRLSRGALSMDASHEHAVMTDLLDLAPPGIDELVAVADVTDALGTSGAEAEFDLVVMDMAPSGHALRLLRTPRIVQEWARALMAILLKYQAVVGIGELGAILLRLSQALGRLGELLRDRHRARLVVVTRGAELPVAETARLVGELAKMKLDVPTLIVNATGRGTCARCRREASAEQRAIASVRRLAARHHRRVLIAPAQVPPPGGFADLCRWAERWR